MESTQYMGTCSFLNMTGDITIAWDESNREKVLEVIRKKMDEGFVFFTTQSFLFHRLTRRVKVTKRNLNSLSEIIVTDEQFDKMVEEMNDRDVAKLVRGDHAELVKRHGSNSLNAMQRAKKAEDVIGRDSLAIRPMHGG